MTDHLTKYFGDEGKKLLEGFPENLPQKIIEKNSNMKVTAYSVDGKLKWHVEKKDE